MALHRGQPAQHQLALQRLLGETATARTTSPVIVSPSLVLPVVGDRAALGKWQSVVLVDLSQDIFEWGVRASFVAG